MYSALLPPSLIVFSKSVFPWVGTEGREYQYKNHFFSHLKWNRQLEIQVCVEYLPDYFKKVTSAFEVNSVFKFESRVPWALLSSSMWQAKVCQLEVWEKGGKKLLAWKMAKKLTLKKWPSNRCIQCSVRKKFLKKIMMKRQNNHVLSWISWF